jgi:hypothetical protein
MNCKASVVFFHENLILLCHKLVIGLIDLGCVAFLLDNKNIMVCKDLGCELCSKTV